MKDLIENIKLKLSEENLNKKNNVLKCYNIIKNYNFNNWNKYKSNFKLNNKTDYYKHSIFSNDIFEIILIKWDKGVKTSLHLHPNNGCILKVLEGKIVEDKYFDKEKYKSSILEKNEMGFMHDILGAHQIHALEDSYSIHLYSPPNFYKKN